MAPKKQPDINLGVLDYKLDELKQGVRDTLQKLETYEIRLQTVELWKSKVEDSIKFVVGSAQRSDAGGDNPWDKYGLKILMVALAIIWGLVTILGGGKVKWPF